MLILLLSLVASQAHADLDVIKYSIKFIQPAINDKELHSIAKAIEKTSKQYDLDWQIMTAIIAQESMFKKDPQNCLKHKLACKDLGIAQINWHTWGKALQLDKKKLVTDIMYNIDVMGYILWVLKNRYGHEKKWHTRYHSFTKEHRIIYDSFISNKYIRIKSFSKGFSMAYQYLN